MQNMLVNQHRKEERKSPSAAANKFAQSYVSHSNERERGKTRNEILCRILMDGDKHIGRMSD